MAEKKQFAIDPDYKEVAQRIVDLYEKYPNAILEGEWTVEAFGANAYIVYTAKCWRDPGDPRPCIGTAMEELPGRTPYTKGSEIQNAETSAWGRAIVAAGASTSKKIASADEVRNADARREADARPAPKEHIDAFVAAMKAIEDPQRRAEVKTAFVRKFGMPAKLRESQLTEATAYIYEAIPELAEDPDPAASTPPTADQAPDEPDATENGQSPAERDPDSGPSGSAAGAGEGRSESLPKPAPAKPSTPQQRQRIGIAFKELVANEIILDGDKAEIVGFLTKGRTTTTTEITSAEAIKLVALAHFLEQGTIKVWDADDGSRQLAADNQPGTGFLATLHEVEQ